MKLRHRFRKVAIEANKAGFCHGMTRHVAAYFQRHSDTLIVTFDNMKSRDGVGPAYPWGFKFVRDQGHSHLGLMMSRRNDWFRHADLNDFFDGLKADGFFAGYRNVVFYGSSMGGYGALNYAAAAPGCRIVAFTPQTSLDPSVVPFETRYRRGFERGSWTGGAYEDGVGGAQSAEQVVVFADPYHPLDGAHVARLPTHNLVWAKCPNMGHDVARMLKHMELLTECVLQAWTGDLTPDGYYQRMRSARGQTQALARAVLNKGIATGHAHLVQNALARLSQSRPEWKFPAIHSSAKAALGGSKAAP